MAGGAISIPVVVDGEAIDVSVMQVGKSWRAHTQHSVGAKLKGLVHHNQRL